MTDDAALCTYDGCSDPVTTKVRTVLGIERFCDKHGWIVRQIESEWDHAEAEYLEQF